MQTIQAYDAIYFITFTVHSSGNNKNNVPVSTNDNLQTDKDTKAN